MSANTAGRIVDFLSSVPDQSPRRGALAVERLASVLAANEGGFTYGEAMTRAELSRSEFIEALDRGIASRLFEISDARGEQRIKLTGAAKTLYGG